MEISSCWLSDQILTAHRHSLLSFPLSFSLSLAPGDYADLATRKDFDKQRNYSNGCGFCTCRCCCCCCCYCFFSLFRDAQRRGPRCGLRCEARTCYCALCNNVCDDVRKLDGCMDACVRQAKAVEWPWRKRACSQRERESSLQE